MYAPQGASPALPLPPPRDTQRQLTRTWGSLAAASAWTACTTASDTRYCTKASHCPGTARRVQAENMRQPSGESQRVPPRPGGGAERGECGTRGV